MQDKLLTLGNQLTLGKDVVKALARSSESAGKAKKLQGARINPDVFCMGIWASKFRAAVKGGLTIHQPLVSEGFLLFHREIVDAHDWHALTLTLSKSTEPNLSVPLTLSCLTIDKYPNGGPEYIVSLQRELVFQTVALCSDDPEPSGFQLFHDATDAVLSAIKK